MKLSMFAVTRFLFASACQRACSSLTAFPLSFRFEAVAFALIGLSSCGTLWGVLLFCSQGCRRLSVSCLLVYSIHYGVYLVNNYFRVITFIESGRLSTPVRVSLSSSTILHYGVYIVNNYFSSFRILAATDRRKPLEFQRSPDFKKLFSETIFNRLGRKRQRARSPRKSVFSNAFGVI